MLDVRDGVRVLVTLLILVAGLGVSRADNRTPSVGGSEKARRARCIARLERASRSLALPGIAVFAHPRGYVRDGALVVEEDSDDPAFQVAIADAEEPAVEAPWSASIEKGIARTHRGKTASIWFGYRIYDERRDAIYAAFRPAVDACLDELPARK